MKIFLIWPGGPETRKLIDKLTKSGHQIVYWVCVAEDIGSRSDMILHEHFKAWDGIPANGVPHEDFLPPDKAFFEKLYRTESIVMTMMNKGFAGVLIDERKTIYHEIVRYWNGVLDLYKPEAIIMPAVPHSNYNFTLYCLAKMRGIKTVMFENPWVSDRILLYNDYEVGSPALLSALEKNKGKKFKVEDLSSDLQEHFLWQTNKKEDHTPFYIKYQKRLNIFSKFFPIKGLLISIKHHSFWRSAIKSLKKRFGPNLKREYKKFEKEPDWGKKFVYMPLSFQPERTSCPQSDIFVNQILATRILSSALPLGWEVFIKEHPSQWILRTGISYNDARFPGYYERLSKIKNVRLVPIDTDTHELMEKSLAVSVVAGSAGWEAALRGKPIINFGLPWYRDFQGSFKVDSVSTVKAVFKKIEQGFKVDRDLVLNYLKCLDEGSSHAYLENFLNMASNLNEDENIEQVAKMINQALKV